MEGELAGSRQVMEVLSSCTPGVTAVAGHTTAVKYQIPEYNKYMQSVYIVAAFSRTSWC